MARPAAVEPQVEAIHQRLNRLAEQKPELAEPVAFYRAMLPLLHEAQRLVEPFNLAPETARQKLAAGVPLLLGEDLPLDLVATRTLFIQLCRMVEELDNSATSSSQRNGWSFFRRNRPDPSPLLEQVHNGDGGALRAAAAAQLRHAVEQNHLDLPAVWQALASDDSQT